MKQTLVLGAISALLVLLSGCASSRDTRFANERKFVVDQEYVNAVDYASRQAGVRVTWVNLPTKRVPVDDDSKR